MPRRTHQRDTRQRQPDTGRWRRPQRPKDVLHEQDRHRARAFRCLSCRLDVSTDALGTAHRNHCPHCLTSRHVDRSIPGDRASPCHGRMPALGMAIRPDGEWMIIHQCSSCGELSANRVAGDDNALALIRLALRPLRNANPSRLLLAV